MLPSRIAICFLAGLLAWAQPVVPSAGTTPAGAVKWKIVIDPGHGGEDRGAIGQKGLKEKDAVLALSRVLMEQLQEAGFEVLLTRDEDVLIPVWDRAGIANDAGADLFISLHLNAHRARAARGSEVYFLSLDAGDADAAELAELENLGAVRSDSRDPVVASILDDMAQRAYLQDSETLAVDIQAQLNHLGGIRERGVKQAPFAVLRSAAMPAVLVEAAFISNPKEEAKLKDAEFRRKVAEAITRGVRSFLARVSVTPKRKAMDPPVSSGTSKAVKAPS